MSDVWGYCSHCQRWFYSGADPFARSDESPCPVCACPAARVADRSQPVQVRG